MLKSQTMSDDGTPQTVWYRGCQITTWKSCLDLDKHGPNSNGPWMARIDRYDETGEQDLDEEWEIQRVDDAIYDRLLAYEAAKRWLDHNSDAQGKYIEL